jgi:hypothetical protein
MKQKLELFCTTTVNPIFSCMKNSLWPRYSFTVYNSSYFYCYCGHRINLIAKSALIADFSFIHETKFIYKGILDEYFLIDSKKLLFDIEE